MDNENRNLQFEGYKILSHKFSEKNNIFDTQLFSFNVAILTLVFFAINASLSCNISKLYYIPFLFSVLCCGASVYFLLITYRRSMDITMLDFKVLFSSEDRNIGELNSEKERLVKINKTHDRWSFRFFIAGFVLAISIIFYGIFTIDFPEKTNNNQTHLMVDEMNNGKNKDTINGAHTYEIIADINKSLDFPFPHKIVSQSQSKPTEQPQKMETKKK